MEKERCDRFKAYGEMELMGKTYISHLFHVFSENTSSYQKAQDFELHEIKDMIQFRVIDTTKEKFILLDEE